MDNSHQKKYYENLIERIKNCEKHHFSDEDKVAFLKMLKYAPLPHIIRINKKSQYFYLVKEYLIKNNMTDKICDNIFLVKDGLRKIDRKMAKLNDKDIKLTDKQVQNKILFNSLVDLGIVTNQEIVSMIPSSFIITIAQKAQPTDLFLDMCAAPGSKSGHILENNVNLIMNEVVKVRANVLSARLGDELEKFVICGDGRKFPLVSYTDDKDFHGTVKFHSILADVPCSGDGTFRKNYLPEETPSRAASIKNMTKIDDDIEIIADIPENKVKSFEELAIARKEFLQVVGFSKNPILNIELLQRALELTENYVIYSTCSLDPIENEFVVANVDAEICDWKEIGNCVFDLVNITDTAKIEPTIKARLVYRPGIQECKKSPFSFSNKKLYKTMRFYPHDNNTGGFYIAILKKRNDFIKKSDPENSAEEEKELLPVYTMPEESVRSIKIKPNLFLKINNTIYNQISEDLRNSLVTFYKLNLPDDCIFLATERSKKKIIMFRSMQAFALAKAGNCTNFGSTVFELDKRMKNEPEHARDYKIINFAPLKPFLTDYIHIKTTKFFRYMLKHSVHFDEIPDMENQQLLKDWQHANGIFYCEGIFCKGYISSDSVTLMINKKEKDILNLVLPVDD
ncbi:tRNA cytosine-5-methylase [Pseudoloma neurophilia]|uniref:tRNA cytosine-5-methylase n=1 Tax=Pseudoloma neurophilia TaxID=146866 RepID=A0A0R0LX94_9MICR|nr:tRNA cytosine-5-methylase [Pseudoloma neurophilia]